MPVTRVQTLPPGTILSWATDTDEFGNPVYVGPPITIAPSGEPVTPQAPVYARAPVPKTTNPLPSVPGSRVYNEHVRDGVRMNEGGVRKYSTGKIKAGEFSGWTNSNAAKNSDDARATTASPTGGGGYSNVLLAKNFDFSNIPAGAIITGIKVHVERSKV